MDQVVDVGAVDPDEECGRAGEHDDAVREDELVAEVRELAAMKPSCASSADSRGKPWYDVFAARISTAKVKIWTTHSILPDAPPAGKTARAVCETTESVELGRACVFTAR